MWDCTCRSGYRLTIHLHILGRATYNNLEVIWTCDVRGHFNHLSFLRHRRVSPDALPNFLSSNQNNHTTSLLLSTEASGKMSCLIHLFTVLHCAHVYSQNFWHAIGQLSQSHSAKSPGYHFPEALSGRNDANPEIRKCPSRPASPTSILLLWDPYMCIYGYVIYANLLESLRRPRGV
jgi:hypothetical protein